MSGDFERYAAVYPHTVPKAVYDLLVLELPGLTDPSRGWARRRLLAELLFSTFRDEHDPERVVLHHERVRALVGIKPSARQFSATEYLQDFDAAVVRLDWADYAYVEGRATSARPVLPDSLWGVIDDEINRRVQGPDVTMVFLDTGRCASRRGRAERLAEYEESLRKVPRPLPEGHPAGPLLEFLGGIRKGIVTKLIKRNRAAIDQAFADLPNETVNDQATRAYASDVIAGMRQANAFDYYATEYSPRVWALGSHPNRLPKAIRKAAYKGAVDFDIKHCHLAAIAMLRPAPELNALLDGLLLSGASLWTTVMTQLGIPTDNEDAKSIIKATVYSMLYGMGLQNLKCQMRQGSAALELGSWLEGEAVVQGLGEELTETFFRLGWVKEVLAIRRHEQDEIKELGHVEDVFGQRKKIRDFHRGKRAGEGRRASNPLAAALSWKLQSYELAVMTSVLPLLRGDKDLRLVAWIHDGIVIWFTNKREEQARRRAVKRALEVKIRELGLKTWVEDEKV